MKIDCNTIAIVLNNSPLKILSYDFTLLRVIPTACQKRHKTPTLQVFSATLHARCHFSASLIIREMIKKHPEYNRTFTSANYQNLQPSYLRLVIMLSVPRYLIFDYIVWVFFVLAMYSAIKFWYRACNVKTLHNFLHLSTWFLSTCAYAVSCRRLIMCIRSSIYT